MISFFSIKTEFKKIIIPIVVFFAIFLTLSCMPLLFIKKFSLTSEGTNPDLIGWSGIMHYINGLGINYILMFSFSTILTYILLKKDNKIDNMHLSNSSNSLLIIRKVINTKLFVLLAAIVIINFNVLFLQLLFLFLAYDDFQAPQQLRLIFNNFLLFLLWVLWSAIIWFIACLFNKTVWFFVISLTLSAIFTICAVLSYNIKLDLKNEVRDNNKLNNLQYLTIASLFNWIIKFDTTTFMIKNNKIHCLAELQAKNYAWQIPTMITAIISLFVISNYILWQRIKLLAPTKVLQDT